MGFSDNRDVSMGRSAVRVKPLSQLGSSDKKPGSTPSQTTFHRGNEEPQPHYVDDYSDEEQQAE
jgi:hypothetical protein